MIWLCVFYPDFSSVDNANRCVPGLKLVDSGTYSCRAASETGETTHDAYLQVRSMSCVPTI